MNLDLRQVGFSRFGSYIVLAHHGAWQDRPEGLVLRSVHGDAGQREIFLVELVKDGQSALFVEQAGPTLVKLQAQGGQAEICMPTAKVLRIRATGVGVRLRYFGGKWGSMLPLAEGGWIVNAAENHIQYLVSALCGTMQAEPTAVREGKWRPSVTVMPDSGGVCEMVVEEFDSTIEPRNYGHFDAAAEAVDREFRAWVDKTLEVPAELAAARELAAYVNWSAVVGPRGHLKRPAMLMSKNWMVHVWSWDHCFNAMALAKQDPQLAWDQLMLFVDLQDEFGMFADAIDDAVIMRNFTKPPIHGWTLRKMMQQTDWIDNARLKEIYGPLGRWTNWWFTYRDYDRDGFPQYNHGNDSGWDNSTAFDMVAPYEGPDLASFLVIQMEVLAEIAGRLGKAGEASRWKERSEAMLRKLMEHSWLGDRFVARQSGTHAYVQDSDSLVPNLPIVLGKRLAADVRAKLVANLREEGRFLTEHGLATESLRSGKYEADGYWRGPIWAPSTMIAVDGLNSAGETDLAREIARRFCNTMARSGFAENFDARTGRGLRDPVYTWTSSAFLLLAHEYLRERK